MQIRTIYTLAGAIKGTVLGFILGVILLIVGVLTILERSNQPSVVMKIILALSVIAWIVVAIVLTFRSRVQGIQTEKNKSGEILHVSIKAYRRFFLWSIILLLVSYMMGAYVFQYNFLSSTARKNSLLQVSTMPTYNAFHQIASLRPVITQDGKNLNIALKTTGGSAGNYNLTLILNNQDGERKTELFPLNEEAKNKLITYSADDLIVTLFSIAEPEDGPPSTTFSFHLDAELQPVSTEPQATPSHQRIALITTLQRNDDGEYRIIQSNIDSN